MHEWVEETAQQRPNAAALVDGDGQSLSYAQLALHSTQVAQIVRGHLGGVAGGAGVGILLPRSFGLVAAMLGVLKARAKPLPLHPALAPPLVPRPPATGTGTGPTWLPHRGATMVGVLQHFPPRLHQRGRCRHLRTGCTGSRPT